MGSAKTKTPLAREIVFGELNKAAKHMPKRVWHLLNDSEKLLELDLLEELFKRVIRQAHNNKDEHEKITMFLWCANFVDMYLSKNKVFTTIISASELGKHKRAEYEIILSKPQTTGRKETHMHLPCQLPETSQKVSGKEREKKVSQLRDKYEKKRVSPPRKPKNELFHWQATNHHVRTLLEEALGAIKWTVK